MSRRPKWWSMRVAAVLTAALTPLALVASPAAADDGWVSSRVWTSPDIQPDANDPGGHVRGYLNFNSRYVMHVEDVTLKDICPGDGHLVYWFLEVDYTLDGHGYKGPKHWSEGTCDRRTSTGTRSASRRPTTRSRKPDCGSASTSMKAAESTSTATTTRATRPVGVATHTPEKGRQRGKGLDPLAVRALASLCAGPLRKIVPPVDTSDRRTSADLPARHSQDRAE